MVKDFGCFRCPCICNCTMHSTFMGQIDGVNCHPACILTLHCAPSRVVKGVPHDILWLLCEMVEATLYFSRFKSARTEAEDPRTALGRGSEVHRIQIGGNMLFL